MIAASKNARGVLAALLVASAVLFAIGVMLERSAESDEPSAASEQSSEAGEAGHSEAEEGHSEESEGEAGEQSEAEHSDSEETLLGIDIESPLAVSAGVLLSLVLAALAFMSTNRIVFVVIALFALTFAVLDGRELFRQLDESRGGLAVLAGLIALLHLGAAVIAGRTARTLPE